MRETFGAEKDEIMMRERGKSNAEDVEGLVVNCGSSEHNRKMRRCLEDI
jgi:hypothetical protein